MQRTILPASEIPKNSTQTGTHSSTHKKNQLQIILFVFNVLRGCKNRNCLPPSPPLSKLSPQKSPHHKY